MASEDTQILDASLNKIQETLAKAGEDKSPAEIAKLANLTAAAEQRKVQADAKQEARDLAQKAREEATAQKWDNLLGHFTWARKFQERTAKAAKAAQSSVIDFGKEKIEFLESLNHEQFEKIQKFFDSMPTLKHDIEITNPTTNVKSTVVLRGISSFFE